MRHATNSTNWIVDENNQMVGLSTGADFCTEHECGMSGLKAALGVPERFEKGVADRVMTKQPTALKFHEYTLPGGTLAAWWVMGSSRYTSMLADMSAQDMPFASEVRFMGKENLSCAWDEDGVVVHVRGAESISNLRQLHQAVVDKNVVLGGSLLTSTQRYNTGGIILLRADRVDPEMAAQTLKEDQSKVRLRAEVARIGLEKELRAAGCRWFALSPRWKDEAKGEIMYWLNPQDQSDHNYGWFSIEQLRQWAKGEGPVMIDKPLRAHTSKLSKPLEKVMSALHQAGFERPWTSVEWKNEDRQEVVVRCYYGKEVEGKRPLMEQGRYSIEALQEMFPTAPRSKKSPKAR